MSEIDRLALPASATPEQRGNGEAVDSAFARRKVAVSDANRDPMPRGIRRHADTVGHDALPHHRPGLHHHIVPQDGPLDARRGINPRVR